MGGRGSTGGYKKGNALQDALNYAREITQQKIEAVKSGKNKISYEFNGKTYNQYYYGGAWHDRPSSMTRVKEYQIGDIDKIINAQKKQRGN